jgi:predicted dinucleotide-binding enzyme
MKVGIIGAGAIGQAVARQVVTAGHDALLSNSRGPGSLREIVQQLGARAHAVTTQEAAGAEIVVLSVPWSAVPQALASLPPWNNRILIDATNPVVLPGFKLAELGGKTSSQVVASLAPGARVVKAMNTLLAKVLGSDPREAGGHRVVFMSGDDAAAKKTVAGLLEEFGFATIDLGTLAVGSGLQQFPGGPLPTLNLIKVS